MEDGAPIMKIGIIIVCRYDSKRLRGKILKNIQGKEVLIYIYERLKKVSFSNDIVVATSRESDDDEIAGFCDEHKINCFRGSKKDVSDRILHCAEEYDFDYFVRICGDNIFADYKLIDKMVKIAIENKYNFVSNLKNRTFPEGISVEILKTEFFKKIVRFFKTTEEKEHVTLYLYNHESEMKGFRYFYNDFCPEAKNIKLSLDDTNDLDFITTIIKNMKKKHTEYLLKDIYELSKGIMAVK